MPDSDFRWRLPSTWSQKWTDPITKKPELAPSHRASFLIAWVMSGRSWSASSTSWMKTQRPSKLPRSSDTWCIFALNDGSKWQTKSAYSGCKPRSQLVFLRFKALTFQTARPYEAPRWHFLGVSYESRLVCGVRVLMCSSACPSHVPRP